jgi:hypothetical protein
MAGLQDIAPMVEKRWVTNAVLAPIRAAALAASQPAWPPPMTMTSNIPGVVIMARLLSRTRESRKKEVWFQAILFHVKHRSSSLSQMFHVKRYVRTDWFHAKPRLGGMNEVILLPYTEFPEDDVQDVFDVDPPQ